MNPVFRLQPSANGVAVVAVRGARYSHVTLSRLAMVLMAVSATSVSLAIATFTGWQRGGAPVERVMNVTLSCVVVLFVHLLPIAWRLLAVTARILAFAMWWTGIAVVLYGQVSFFIVSQQHSGDAREASIPAISEPPRMAGPTGRTRTEIAQDVSKVTTTLALADARLCTSDCRPLVARRAMLTARLAALNVEADEASRLEAANDRRTQLLDRNEALRSALRADPVASVVAPWFRTTEGRFELVLAVGCAVVLESAAIIGWQLMSIALCREACAQEREAAGSLYAAVAPESDLATGDDMMPIGERAVVASEQCDVAPEIADNRGNSEDDLLLEKIHAAVILGDLKPTQAEIRVLLRCGQQKAGRLKRLYLIRFGNARN